MLALITTESGDLFITEDGKLLEIELFFLEVKERFTVESRRVEFVVEPREVQYETPSRTNKFFV